jgi:hypothetical protein
MKPRAPFKTDVAKIAFHAGSLRGLHMTGRQVDLRELKRPKCKACGAPMLLVRRTPDPDHDAKQELRTFMCFKCKRKMTVPTVLDERLHMIGNEVDLREMKRPKCKGCGASTTLVRRSPDPDRGARHELRTFMCFKCKRERTVSMVLNDKKVKRLGAGPRSIASRP